MDDIHNKVDYVDKLYASEVDTMSMELKNSSTLLKGTNLGESNKQLADTIMGVANLGMYDNIGSKNDIILSLSSLNSNIPKYIIGTTGFFIFSDEIDDTLDMTFKFLGLQELDIVDISNNKTVPIMGLNQFDIITFDNNVVLRLLNNIQLANSSKVITITINSEIINGSSVPIFRIPKEHGNITLEKINSGNNFIEIIDKTSMWTTYISKDVDNYVLPFNNYMVHTDLKLPLYVKIRIFT